MWVLRRDLVRITLDADLTLRMVQRPDRAACAETAAAGWVVRVGHLALEHVEAATLPTNLRHRAKQGIGVGVVRPLEQRDRRSDLDNLREVHDVHGVGT